MFPETSEEQNPQEKFFFNEKTDFETKYGMTSLFIIIVFSKLIVELIIGFKH